MEATVLYPPTQAADGIRLARLIAQDKGMSVLVQVEVPKRVVLVDRKCCGRPLIC